MSSDTAEPLHVRLFGPGTTVLFKRELRYPNESSSGSSSQEK